MKTKRKIVTHGQRRNGERNETTIRLRIEELDEGGYLATSPDVPGLVAAYGKTRREALKNVEVVIQEWIETARELGRPIPQPKGRLVFA